MFILSVSAAVWLVREVHYCVVGCLALTHLESRRSISPTKACDTEKNPVFAKLSEGGILGFVTATAADSTMKAL